MALKGRKGYFFLIDAFLAMSVMALGMLLIYSFHSYSPQQVQPLLLADDVMESLSSNNVDDLAGNTSRAGFYVRLLAERGNITNMQNTLLEQIGEYYWLGEDDLARGFAINITSEIVPNQYGFEYHINPVNLTHSDFVIRINSITATPEDAMMLVTSKRVVAGVANESMMWGPMVMEARVWL